MNKFGIVILISLLVSTGLNAFNDNLFTLHSLKIEIDSVKTKTKKHSAHRASIYSALLPGLGQAYNEKYWKIPIVYAAIGTSAYLTIFNRTEMKKRQDALNAMLDGDSTTIVAADMARFSESVLKAERNYYRTNRDYSIIALAGFYVLNIIDAAVDAHFYKFNIDKPLAERREKRWHIYSSRLGNINTIGLSWRF